MSTLVEQADDFKRYVVEQSDNGGGNLSLTELFRRWQAVNLSGQQLGDSLESLERGLTDVDAGRVVDAADAIADTRSRLQQ